ncbi:hypothetical protein [Desulfopila aestuarii]|uniref:Uncharacterized protein n=1 Tax=Desulfopila aestuarii DSM 18488 TaxID=1121416 RepID=A0A1M7YI64_9BACT|nr:hypothetical protein [Desulfopila aestuarii]SHO52306.1 hypothetical protein SAMN02745220_04507 [Desulfopila aestuarii DSM 18488]
MPIQNPRSGRTGEVVYDSRKKLVRLTDYTKAKDIDNSDRIFPISYVDAWSMVRKAGTLVNMELRPHDLRPHPATYVSVSRSGTRIEIVSKVILRHANLQPPTGILGR